MRGGRACPPCIPAVAPGATSAPTAASSTTGSTRKTIRRVLGFARPHRAPDLRLPGPDRHRRGHGRGDAAAGAADRRRRHPRRRRPDGDDPGPGDGRRRDLHRGSRRARRLALLADRRGADLRPAHQGVRARAAPVAGLLHPHPDRCAGLPAQQRRDRRPAGVHLDPVQHGLQRHRRARRRHRHARAELADHPALPGALPDPLLRLALGQRPARRPHPAPDGRQRRPRQRDDRAVQRGRRDAAQAVRPPRRGGRPVRRPGRQRARPRASGSR